MSPGDPVPPVQNPNLSVGRRALVGTGEETANCVYNQSGPFVDTHKAHLLSSGCSAEWVHTMDILMLMGFQGPPSSCDNISIPWQQLVLEMCFESGW